jgi:hypothetical protein
MTQMIPDPPLSAEPSRMKRGVTALCLAAVAIAALFSRKTGACGTAHYLFFQLLGGSIVSTIEDVSQRPLPYDRLIASVLIYGLNVAAFCGLLRLWYRKTSESRYVWGALALTSVYLVSYFYLLPTVDCP